MSTDIPVGSIVHHAPDGLMVWAGQTLLMADGAPFSAVEHPELANVLTKPRPRWLWHRPISTWRARKAWDDGDRMVFGGTMGVPNLPDFRGRIV